MKLDEFLLNYFDEEGIRAVCASLRVQASGSKDESVKAIIASLDAIKEFDKAEGAMEMIFDCAFELEDAVLKKVLADAKMDACGSKMALLNRVMANLVWPSSIEAQVNRESKLTGDIHSVRI
jgi:hypothetical protein